MRAELYRFVAAAGRDHHLAEDIVQETLLRAVREQGEVRDPRAWCFTVALNLLRSHFRRRRWLPLRAAESVEGWEFVERHASRDAVHRALAALRPDQRATLLLHALAGFTHAEIAAMQSISEAAARQRLHRARAAFARAYAIRETD
jgi:RNA polymerase sigma-70 factor (ECF subfamily)